MSNINVYRLTSIFIAIIVAFFFIVSICAHSRLKIVIPKGYSGKVILVLSNVRHNILTVDSNGIGYINLCTFNTTYLKPLVVDAEGNNMVNQCKGYSASIFWSMNNYSFPNAIDEPPNKGIDFLSFEVVSKDGQKRELHQNKDLIKLINKEYLIK